MGKTLKVKKGGSAKLVKHTKKTLSEANLIKGKTEKAVEKLNKAIHKFKDTLKKLSTTPKKKKKKKTKKTTPPPTSPAVEEEAAPTPMSEENAAPTPMSEENAASPTPASEAENN